MIQLSQSDCEFTYEKLRAVGVYNMVMCSNMASLADPSLPRFNYIPIGFNCSDPQDEGIEDFCE